LARGGFGFLVIPSLRESLIIARPRQASAAGGLHRVDQSGMNFSPKFSKILANSATLNSLNLMGGLSVHFSTAPRLQLLSRILLIFSALMTHLHKKWGMHTIWSTCLRRTGSFSSSIAIAQR
jgi:hypothetical protein